MNNYISKQFKMCCYANHLVRLQLGYPKQLYGWIHYKILAVFPTKTWGGRGDVMLGTQHTLQFMSSVLLNKHIKPVCLNICINLNV